MEMIYGNPLVFKKMFTFFKTIAARELCMSFDEKTITILTIDHLRKSTVKVVISCNKLNHYYCKSPVKCFLNAKNIGKIIQTIDKNCVSLSFVLKKISYRSNLTIILKNEIQIDEIKDIELVHTSIIIPDVSFDDSLYPIKFTMPSRYFKKLISDIDIFSETITIDKVGHNPLVFSYSSKDKTIKSKHIVRVPENISLESLIKKDDIFSSTINIDYIKPISTSLLAKNIQISSDTHKNIIFRVDVDEHVISLVVNTSIVRL